MPDSFWATAKSRRSTASKGLSPAISIDQKTTSNNPRSTVGTVTEIYDYLRLLYARIGVPYCPTHHEPITSQTVKQMIDRIMELPDRTRMVILAPIVKGKKGTHKDLLATLTREGYVRVRIDGEDAHPGRGGSAGEEQASTTSMSWWTAS